VLPGSASRFLLHGLVRPIRVVPLDNAFGDESRERFSSIFESAYRFGETKQSGTKAYPFRVRRVHEAESRERAERLRDFLADRVLRHPLVAAFAPREKLGNEPVPAHQRFEPLDDLCARDHTAAAHRLRIEIHEGERLSDEHLHDGETPASEPVTMRHQIEEPVAGVSQLAVVLVVEPLEVRPRIAQKPVLLGLVPVDMSALAQPGVDLGEKRIAHHLLEPVESFPWSYPDLVDR